MLLCSRRQSRVASPRGVPLPARTARHHGSGRAGADHRLRAVSTPPAMLLSGEPVQDDVGRSKGSRT